jgi:hypothetical protein
LRESEGDGSDAVYGDGPIVDDALDAGVEGIDDRADFQVSFGSDFPQDSFGEFRRNAMGWETDSAIVAQAARRDLVERDE